MESNLIREVFTNILSYVVVFKRDCASTQPEIGLVDNDISNLLKESATLSIKNNIDPRVYDDARFAVCALIDETLMNSLWRFKDDWRRMLLQVRLYNTSNAGSEFFDRFNGLASDQTYLRELYCTCMAIGFSGRYSLDADKVILSQLKRTSINEILSKHDFSKQMILGKGFTTVAQTHGDTGSKEQLIKFSDYMKNKKKIMLLVVPPLIILFIFFIYSYVIDGAVKSFMLTVVEG